MEVALWRLDEEGDLLPRAGVFRAGGEAGLVGEEVGLEGFDAAVARGGVEGEGFADDGEEGLWSAAIHRRFRWARSAVAGWGTRLRCACRTAPPPIRQRR